MKYVYKGNYANFMGRMFAFGVPVDVTDKATLEKLSRNPDFRAVEEKEEVMAEPKTQVPDVCPKCGRTVKRGKVMHQKYCKGPK